MKRKSTKKTRVERIESIIAFYAEMQKRAVRIMDDILKTEQNPSVPEVVHDRARVEIAELRRNILSAIAVVQFDIREPIPVVSFYVRPNDLHPQEFSVEFARVWVATMQHYSNMYGEKQIEFTNRFAELHRQIIAGVNQLTSVE